MSHPISQADQNRRPYQRWYQATWARVLRVLASGAAVLAGLGLVVVVVAVGHCSAFGGTCPRQSGFPADVFRPAALGGALAAAVPGYLREPSWRRLVRSLVIGLVVGVGIGFFAVGATAS
jgi:hypothetical protein